MSLSNITRLASSAAGFPKTDGSTLGANAVITETILGHSFTLLFVVTIFALVLTQPMAAFTVDEYFYIQMASAMAGEGRLSFQQINHIAGQAIPMGFAFPIEVSVGGSDMTRLAPQYPSGYALIAAPFYKAFGLRGLFLLNTLSFLVCIHLVGTLSRQIGLSNNMARLSAIVFAFGSYAGGYAFAVWPHCLTLVFVLGAVVAALKAEAGARSTRWIMISGLMSGAALTVRVDAVVTIIALALWLRLFSGLSRARILFYFAALIPGVLAAAYLNELKFGVFHPFTYGKVGEGNDFADYAVLFGMIVAAYLASCIIDLQRAARLAGNAWSKTASIPSARATLGVMTLIAVALLVINVEAVSTIVFGATALLFDLQINAERVGDCTIAPGSFGVSTFCGLYKRTVLQSMPFVALSLYVLGTFSRQPNRAHHALLWLIAFGYVGLYALNAWHGGLSMSMRYLLPVAASLSVLSVVAFADLQDGQKTLRSHIIALLICGAMAAAALPILLPTDLAASLKGILHLYPSLMLASAILVLAVACLWSKGKAPRRAATLFTIAAIGAGATNTAGDIVLERQIRTAFAAREAAAAQTVATDALVLSGSPARFSRLALKGTTVIVPWEGEEARMGANIDLFRQADRPVYVDGKLAETLVRSLGYPLEMAGNDQYPLMVVSGLKQASRPD